MFLLICLFSISLASKGTSIYHDTALSTLSCLKSSKLLDFVIRKAVAPYPDMSCVYTVQEALNLGLTASNIDILFEPSMTSSESAETQVTNLVNFLKSTNVAYTRIWYSTYTTWKSSKTENTAFLEKMMAKAISLGKAGIVGSKEMWSTNFGASYTYKDAASVPLWYVSPDGDASFGNFVAFGGWSKPTMKTYEKNVWYCSLTEDLVYRA
ncbi:lysozyme, putative [Entamoeba invadens IP1]|uniref:Lysozyme, putative n=1 Tax=Entamoeba invadens IP1 TaxID=370355 RepID=L7FN74_ENTIV|nr:lysozyme, putative [Entamoeba invadens IP1]ELP92506.1 lysozyme, putative [Entamoeba invadens IP1]|eukprot:XP_004259277.1 lysozyme, putative [Entamoeba invadens IP1]